MVKVLDCSCKVNVEFAGGDWDMPGSIDAEVYVGETQDLGIDQLAWCTRVLTGMWPGITTHTITKDQWTCGELRPTSVEASQLISREELTTMSMGECLVPMHDNSTIECLVGNSGKVRLGTRSKLLAQASKGADVLDQVGSFLQTLRAVAFTLGSLAGLAFCIFAAYTFCMSPQDTDASESDSESGAVGSPSPPAVSLLSFAPQANVRSPSE